MLFRCKNNKKAMLILINKRISKRLIDFNEKSENRKSLTVDLAFELDMRVIFKCSTFRNSFYELKKKIAELYEEKKS